MHFFSMKYINDSKPMAEQDLLASYERGMAGEEEAVRYLLSEGYRILRRNYRYRKAEIDVLALQGNCLAVVEVKTRKGPFYESLADSVPRAKVRRLVMAADHFVRNSGLDVEVRFDIIQITGSPGRFCLVHIPDAFYFF
jgi:putative endonuclease